MGVLEELKSKYFSPEKEMLAFEALSSFFDKKSKDMVRKVFMENTELPSLKINHFLFV